MFCTTDLQKTNSLLRRIPCSPVISTFRYLPFNVLTLQRSNVLTFQRVNVLTYNYTAAEFIAHCQCGKVISSRQGQRRSVLYRFERSNNDWRTQGATRPPGDRSPYSSARASARG